MNPKEVNTLSVAVMGIGNMGRHHARIYHSMPQVDLVAVIDHKEDNLKRISEELGVPAYSSIDAAIADQHIDAINIVLPSMHHYQYAKEALDHGCHVLIEKPFTHSSETAQELIDYAKSKNRTLTVGHIERFNPAYTALKALVDSGELGKIYAIDAKRLGPCPPQIKDDHVLMDLAVHDIDLVCDLYNQSPLQIDSQCTKVHLKDRVDYASIFMKFETGGVAQIESSWASPVRKRCLTVQGSKGTADLDFMTKRLIQYSLEDENSREIEHKIEDRNQLADELSHFIESIQGDTPVLVTGEHGKRAVDIALEAEEDNMKEYL